MTPLALAIAAAVDEALHSPEGLARSAIKDDITGEWWKINADYETVPHEHIRLVVRRKDVSDANL